MAVDCPQCDTSWETYKKYSAHFGQKHEGVPLVALIGEEKLKSMYSQMSTPEMAEKLGLSRGPIREALKVLDIDRRGQSAAMDFWYEDMTEEQRKELTKNANKAVTKLPTIYTGKRGYEHISHIGHEVYLHRLFAVAVFGFEEVIGKVVHHRNGIKWDNREENIELLTDSEHNRMHAKESRFWEHRHASG